MNKWLSTLSPWFTIGWWKYLLAKPAYGISLWTAFHCRRKGHAGIIFYNPQGDAPDFHCKNCYDDLE